MKNHTIMSRQGYLYKRVGDALIFEGEGVKLKIARSDRLEGGWDFAFTDGKMTHGITIKNANKPTTAIGAYFVCRAFMRQKIGKDTGNFKFHEVTDHGKKPTLQ